MIPALLLPRDGEDRPLWEAFDHNAHFLVRSGVSGLCVNGATGEYTGATASERREAILRAREIAGQELTVLSGAGATRWTRTAEFAKIACLAGADAVLVPAPHFFKYEQQDLAEFYRRIAAESPIPVLLYNLPAFTGELKPAVAAELIRDVAGITGVKDSSGELELLSLLTGADSPNGVVRLVGNDAVLAEALERGLCDGTVSGVAGVVPELTLALWRSASDRDWDRLHRLASLQHALVGRLDEFPAPWGLKFVAEVRGLAPANPALPLSAERRRQAGEFGVWFLDWWNSAAAELGGPCRVEV